MRCLLPGGVAITVRTPLFLLLWFSIPTFFKLGKIGDFNMHLLFTRGLLAIWRSRRSAGISAFALLTSACVATELQHWVICFKVTSKLCPCICGPSERRGGGCGPGAAPSFRNSIHDNIMSSIKKYRWSKPHIKTRPIKYGYEPPLAFAPQIKLKGITVTMWTRLSIAALCWGLSGEWMIISFPLLSLSLTCRNSQFMQAAPWPGKVDASHRREKQPC